VKVPSVLALSAMVMTKGQVAGQVRVQLADVVRQDFLLVVHRHGDLDQAVG
jgi:hypothetical protein